MVTTDFCPMPKPVSKKVRPIAAEIPEDSITAFHVQLGRRIKDLRKRKGFRLDHFCYEINIARNTLIAIEAGKGCTSETLLRIIYGLGVDLVEFFAEGFEPLQPPVTERPQS
jgi:DNA-binding XRE family transcriptional regulator